MADMTVAAVAGVATAAVSAAARRAATVAAVAGVGGAWVVTHPYKPLTLAAAAGAGGVTLGGSYRNNESHLCRRRRRLKQRR